MLLNKITMYNYRQYYGKQFIEFSRSSTKNVTVIHGENGSGKTALLNAFIWCLYGDLNLPNPQSICNEHAINKLNVGDVTDVYVELEFEAFSKQYTLKRQVRVEKISEEQVHYHEERVDFHYIDYDGLSKKIENTTQEINKIIPKDLRSYFFFDGERIDNLTKDNGTEDIKRAIKSIMGLEILERAIRHTEQARRKFRSELKESGNSEAQKIYEELDQLDSEQDKYNEKRKLMIENLSVIDKQIREREERLTQLEGAKYLQEKREELKEELFSLNEEMKNTEKELVNLISKHGYLALTTPIISQSLNVINEDFEDNNYIQGITKSFINKIIENGVCICGEKIEPDSNHYEHLKKLSDSITADELINLIYDFKQKIKIIEERRNNLFIQLEKLKKQQSDQKNHSRRLNEQISEISHQLSEHKTEEISDLENKRIELMRDKDNINQQIGSINNELKKINERKKELDNIQKKIKLEEEKSNLARKRMNTCQELIDIMNQVLQIRESIVKDTLQEEISKVYKQFLRKNYEVKLTDEYMLNVINESGNVVAMSQGERQITSLSFIGAIVDIARATFNKNNKSAFDEGGIYPLVMDSPFGALDSDHRERVSKGIHKLADQVIVIVSTSQWRGEVEGQMKSVVGKEYKLEYNDPRYNKDKPYEFTEVKEVSNSYELS